MTHRTVDSGPHEPLRLVVVGAGAMGRTWTKAVGASAETRLAGIADLDPDAAHQAASDVGRPGMPVGTDAVALAAETGAQAVVNVTVPAAHHPVTTRALLAGLPVLGEKPAAESVARALSLAAASEVSGELFMVSQSRRWNPHLFALRDMLEQMGAVGTVATEFFKAPRFGGFREEMAYPLLVDMAIHAFDSLRFLLGTDPVSVYCEAYNPPWSWYGGDAAATAVFEMAGGARCTYIGSWCAPGAETSWNGSWRISSEKGTALWDGDNAPVPDAEFEPPAGERASFPDGIEGIDRALSVFVDALRTGTTPMGEVHENVMSLAMVEAAVESARTGRRVLIEEALEKAYAVAVRDESRPEVRDALAAWPSARAALNARKENG